MNTNKDTYLNLDYTDSAEIEKQLKNMVEYIGSLKSSFKNNYYGLRHARSIPNDKDIIISSLEEGMRDKYSISFDGLDQVRTAAKLFVTQIKPEQEVDNYVLVSSPFSRTLDTAKFFNKAIIKHFDNPMTQYRRVFVNYGLRERFFGIYEGTSSDNYSNFWEEDKNSCYSSLDGGEPTAHVALRMLNVIKECEKAFDGCNILLVSHGDPLVILDTILKGEKLEDHNLTPHYKNSEVRGLIRSNSVKY